MAAASISTDAAYTIDYSCRFNTADTAVLSRANGTATSSTTATISFWFKIGVITNQQGFFGAEGFYTGMTFNSSDQLYLVHGSAGTAVLTTTQVFRDPSAWYHCMVVFDTTESVGSDRVKLYINGLRVMAYTSGTFPTEDEAFARWNTSGYTNLVADGHSTYPNFDGYLSEFHSTDGTAYGPEKFGEFNNGVWRPIEVSGVTYGNNGFYFDFADSSNLGNDVSGNDNDFTSSGLAADDQMDDTPTTNYCTLSPIRGKGTITYSDGNLDAVGAVAAQSVAVGSIATTSGKFIYASQPASITTNIGEPYLANESYFEAGLPDLNSASNVWGIKLNTSTTWIVEKEGTGTTITHGFSGGWEAGVDFLVICFDVDNSKIWCGGYDVSADVLAFTDGSTGVTGDPGAGTNATATISGTEFTGVFDFWNTRAADTDFGQADLLSQITIPTGFKFLNTANLPKPTIQNGKKYFDTILYEGNGVGQKAGQFQPITETYSVGNSAMFDGSDDKLTRTFDTGGDRKKWTISLWFKRCGAMNNRQGLFSVSGSYFQVGPDSGFEEEIILYNGGGSGTLLSWLTKRRFSDPTQWVNLVWSFDSAQAAAADRTTLSVDGIALSADDFQRLSDVSQDYEGSFNSNQLHQLATHSAVSTTPFNGYLAEICFIDSAVLGASSFGEVDSTTNRWVPKDVSGLTFGTTGFYLDMVDGNALGDDESGNTNDWAMVNMDTTNKSNQFYDSPTRNFAILDPGRGTSTSTYSNGNLTQTSPGAATGAGTTPQPFGLTSGKWYWEMRMDDGTNNERSMIMIQDDVILAANTWVRSRAGTYSGYRSYAGNAITSGDISSTTGESTAYGDTYTSGDVLSCAIDLDIGAIWWAKNGTWQASATEAEIEAGDTSNAAQSGLASGAWYPCVQNNDSWSTTVNFGQHIYYDSTALTLDTTAGGYFRYGVPDGFKAINVDALKESDSFQSAFSWIKNRDAADNHMLFDRVRGIYKDLHSNTTDVEVTNRDTLQRFLKQGATIGEDVQVNTFNERYVYWDWFIETTGSGSANTDGATDTTSTLVDTTSGVSISTYTGTGSATTFGHGLGAVPKFMICKERSDAVSDWICYHNNIDSTPEDYLIKLNTTAAKLDDATAWNDTAPTSTVFTVGTHAFTNDSGKTFVNYSFAEVEGFSSFGKYVGNGLTAANGPFCYTGFKPEFVIFKDVDRAVSWMAMSYKFGPNPNKWELLPDTNGIMGSTYDAIDFLSNGFRVVNTVGYYAVNWSGENYIWMAWAANPFGGASTTPATAV